MTVRLHRRVPLQLPAFEPIPEAGKGTQLLEIPVARLRPTQWCVGLAEVWARQQDFAQENREQRLSALKQKPGSTGAQRGR